MIDASKKNIVYKTITLFVLITLISPVFSSMHSTLKTKTTDMLDTKLDTNNNKKINANNTKKPSFLDIKINFFRRLMLTPSLSVCAIKNDEIVFYKGYGYSDIYRQEKPNKTTIYPIGSITKTITTTALLQLYEEGYFDLDDDINKYLPFDLRNPFYPDVPITIRMVLSHRASLFDYEFFTLRGMISTIINSGIPTDLENWLNQTLTPDGKWYNKNYWHNDYAPGEEACYSNTGFLIIAYLVKKLSNQSLEEYCQKNIFQPLHMYNTSYNSSKLNQSHLAETYAKRLGIFIPLPDYSTGAFRGIGGVKSNIEDLSHFLIAHMNNGTYKDTQILNKTTIKLMHNCKYKGCKIISPLNRYYGLGWWCRELFDREIQGHGGMIPGGSCFMMMNESASIGYITMANQFNILGFFSTPKVLIETFSRSIIGELLLQKTEQIKQ